jgi:hypothetical protein
LSSRELGELRELARCGESLDRIEDAGSTNLRTDATKAQLEFFDAVGKRRTRRADERECDGTFECWCCERGPGIMRSTPEVPRW